MNPIDNIMNNPKGIFGFAGTAIIILLVVILLSSSSFIIPPGHRGVLVTMGKVSPVFAPEGFGLKMPFITSVVPISIRQETKMAQAVC